MQTTKKFFNPKTSTEVHHVLTDHGQTVIVQVPTSLPHCPWCQRQLSDDAKAQLPGAAFKEAYARIALLEKATAAHIADAKERGVEIR